MSIYIYKQKCLSVCLEGGGRGGGLPREMGSGQEGGGDGEGRFLHVWRGGGGGVAG